MKTILAISLIAIFLISGCIGKSGVYTQCMSLCRSDVEDRNECFEICSDTIKDVCETKYIQKPTCENNCTMILDVPNPVWSRYIDMDCIDDCINMTYLINPEEKNLCRNKTYVSVPCECHEWGCALECFKCEVSQQNKLKIKPKIEIVRKIKWENAVDLAVFDNCTIVKRYGKDYWKCIGNCEVIIDASKKMNLGIPKECVEVSP